MLVSIARLLHSPGWLIAVFTLLPLAPAMADPPQVVVSIKPIHSLVAGVMQGVAVPDLLLRGAESPHDFSLRPSDMRRLQRADLIVWVGPEVEPPLSRLLQQGGLRDRVVTLTQIRGVDWLPPREGPEWESHAAHEPQAEDQHAHHEGEIDSHIWLSPVIARGIVSQIADRLCELDPPNASGYRENARQLTARLEQLDAELASALAPVRKRPFIVFHDAYHYFEQHYGLNAVGSVTLSPERQPGARHLHELREKIRRLQARCVFAEPQFRPKLIATLIEGTDARAGRLDPLGQALQAGPDAYFSLLRNLVGDLLACLDSR